MLIYRDIPYLCLYVFKSSAADLLYVGRGAYYLHHGWLIIALTPFPYSLDLLQKTLNIFCNIFEKLCIWKVNYWINFKTSLQEDKVLFMSSRLLNWFRCFRMRPFTTYYKSAANNFEQIKAKIWKNPFIIINWKV